MWQKLRITRDAFVVFVALSLAIYEVTSGGGRPAVLAFLGSLLLSPIVMRIDEARKRVRKSDDSDID